MKTNIDLGDLVSNYKRKEIVDAVKEYNSRKPAEYEKKAEGK